MVPEAARGKPTPVDAARSSFFSAFQKTSRRGFSEFTPDRLQSTLKAQSARRPDKKRRGEFPRSHSLPLAVPSFVRCNYRDGCSREKPRKPRQYRPFPRQRDNGNLIASLSFHGFSSAFQQLNLGGKLKPAKKLTL